MGAEQFYTQASGRSSDLAFAEAVKQAQYDHGHSGYTGTIAEKDDFVMVLPEPVADLATATALAEKMIYDGDPRVDNKWGPACVIEYVTPEADRADGARRSFLFFGWASS